MTELLSSLLLPFGLALDDGQLLPGVAFDDGQHLILFHDEVLLAIQLDLLARILAEQDPVARFDVERDPFAVVFTFPLPTATTVPCCGFSLAVSGMMIPPTCCSPSSRR